MTSIVLLISLEHSFALQSLQQKNLELLSVVRQLGSEKENEAAAMQAAKEEERKHVEEELSAIQAENARVQVGGHAPSPAQHCSIYAQTGTVEYGQKDCKLSPTRLARSICKAIVCRLQSACV